MRTVAIVVFVFLINIIYSQKIDNDYFATIVTDINNYELENADIKIRNLNDHNSKILFQNEVNYLKTGAVSNDILSLNTSNFNYYLKAIYYDFLGDYYFKVSKKFSDKSYQLYLNSYKLGLQYHNISLQQESLRRMLNLFQKSERNFKQLDTYSNKYLALNNDFINTFWARYYYLFKKFYEREELKKKNNFSITDYDSLLIYCNQKPILKAKVYQIMGICYNQAKNYKLSNEYIENAKFEYGKSNNYYSQEGLKRIEFNEGFQFLETGNLKKAIAVFRKSEQSKFFKRDLKSKVLISDALYKTYSKAKNNDSTIYYLNKKTIYEDSLKREESAIAIHEIDTKFHVKEKDQKIESQNQLLVNYEHNKWLYLSLITLVFVVAMYSFVRWKKVDFRRKKLAQEKDFLQAEHFQTIEKLKKVNQLVVQDNIILKNKTKIYLNELQYIKADDHYLNIFTKDGKNHFVRGRLADIMEELPPNFVKCHRSYIVNKNFVKSEQAKFLVMADHSEIPISRGFKLSLSQNFKFSKR